MSLFRRREASLSALIQAASGARPSTGSVSVTADSALRHSAVWACLRLRADLVSTLPVDVFRRVGGIQVEVPASPFITAPDGTSRMAWMYASQFDLDRYGNCFGLITARDGQGLPARVELVEAGTVSVIGQGARITRYRIGGAEYDPGEVWHERQYTVAGVPLGLSPIAYAAWSVGGYLSAQQFALDWFGSGAANAGHLRNTVKQTLTQDEAAVAKAAYKRATANRDLFVTGKDWEMTLSQVPASGVMFLDQMRFGVADVARFLSVPGDMIDAETSTGSITYANVTQRNMQFLILNLGPAILRREEALSAALPRPRYVKLNTDALLRMDPQARSQVILAKVAGRVLAPSEARELDNLPPFTVEQLAEFDALFGAANRAPQAPQTGVPA